MAKPRGIRMHFRVRVVAYARVDVCIEDCGVLMTIVL